MKFSMMMKTTLVDHIPALDDPRQSGKVLYRLSEILLLILCAVMAGADVLVEIERWCHRKLDFLRHLSPFRRGVPSHDKLNDVMNALPAALFPECLLASAASSRGAEPDIVTIDGRTSRRAKDAGATRCIRSRPGPAADGWCSDTRPCPERTARSGRSCGP